MKTENITGHVSGDTFLGLKFELSNELGPISLVGASITLLTDRDSNEISTANGGMTITDAANGKFEINEQIISWVPATYNYKIRVTFASGRKKTYVMGTWEVI